MKIGLGYGIIIVINLLIAFFAVYHINRLGSPVDQVLRENYRNVNAPTKMREALKKQELAHYDMIAEGFDSAKLERFQTFQNEFYNWNQRAIEAIALPSEPAILDSINNTYAIYLIKSWQLQQQLSENFSAERIDSLQENSIYPLVKRIESLCNQLQRVNENAIREADSRAEQVSNRATALILSVALVAIIASILISAWFMRSILGPIRQTTETVRQISQGNLNKKIDITTEDEIGELAREFNKMTERLQEYERLNVQRLIQEKKKSETIVSEIPVAIIVTDETDRLTHINQLAREILQITSSWEGKFIGDVIGIDQTSHDLDFLISGGEELNKQIVTLQKDDSTMHLWFRRIIINDPESNASVGSVTLLQDITSFQNLDRLKSEFMAVISHEIRTPLTAIHLALDILLREVKGGINADQKELLADAKGDSTRLKTLIKDLLDLSKLESGSLDMSFELVSFNLFTEDALKPIRFLLKEREIKLTIEHNRINEQVEIDPHHFARVLLNLVENAVDHSPDGSTIHLKTDVMDEEHLLLTLQDEGSGIPQDAIHLIFDKFIQVKNFSDSGNGKIGLGLAIAKEVVAAHRGSIWAESNPGKGSTFYLKIPLNQREEHSRATLEKK